MEGDLGEFCLNRAGDRQWTWNRQNTDACGYETEQLQGRMKVGGACCRFVGQIRLSDSMEDGVGVWYSTAGLVQGVNHYTNVKDSQYVGV